MLASPAALPILARRARRRRSRSSPAGGRSLPSVSRLATPFRSMPDAQTQLSGLFVDAFRQLEPSRPTPDVEVRFYPYAGLNHTIRLRSGRVYVRVSDLFRDAPMNVHRSLAFILVAKLLRRRTPQVHERVYRDYA